MLSELKRKAATKIMVSYSYSVDYRGNIAKGYARTLALAHHTQRAERASELCPCKYSTERVVRVQSQANATGCGGGVPQQTTTPVPNLTTAATTSNNHQQQ